MDQLEQQLFDISVAALPRTFVLDVLRVLPLVYREATARSFQEPAWEMTEGHDICGHFRRALFEMQFRKIATSHGLYAKPQRNCRRTAYHTIVRTGRLVLTASAIQQETTMARPALFRKQHAAINSFLRFPFIPELGIEPPELYEPGEIYAILFHGPKPKAVDELGFVTLGFPSESSQGLLCKFPLTMIARAQSNSAYEPLAIEDQALPRLKAISKVGD